MVSTSGTWYDGFWETNYEILSLLYVKIPSFLYRKIMAKLPFMNLSFDSGQVRMNLTSQK